MPKFERWLRKNGTDFGIGTLKRGDEQRVAEVHRLFAQLELIRDEITVAFADLGSAFKKFV